jgi:hypothetical protein
MRFTFAIAGWPSSAHDTRILHHTLANFPSFPLRPKGKTIISMRYVTLICCFFLCSLHVFSGKYYLVDSGYPNRIGYLAPFKGSTYHLPEFCLRCGRAPQGKYEIFNFLHSSLRNVIERAFGVLKQKWRILKAMPSFSPRTQKHVILACMALHNFIRDSKLRDEEFDKCDEDEDYLPESAHATPHTQGDDVLEVENEESMNDLQSRIADALLMARQE